MTEEMLEVRAALNGDTNEPVYGTCTLSVGDGSVKVAFQNGRAVVPRSVVEKYLVQNGGIEVPALGIFRSRISSGATVQSQDSVTAEGPATVELEDMTPEERLATAKRLSDLIERDQGGDPDPAKEQAAADQQPGPTTTVDEAATEGSKPLEEETEKERNLRLAREHLEAEGEEVPEVEATDDDAKEPGADEPPAAAPRVVPEGFDDKTGEGEPRCLAKKSDGAQCKNAAKDGGPACQLEAHAKQFAA